MPRSCGRWRRSTPLATRLRWWRSANGAPTRLALQRLVYYDMREQFGLSSQMTIRAISKVSEAYKRDKKIQPALPPAWGDGL